MAVIYKVEHVLIHDHTCTWEDCKELASHIVREYNVDTGMSFTAYTCDIHTDMFNDYARRTSKEVYE